MVKEFATILSRTRRNLCGFAVAGVLFCGSIAAQAQLSVLSWGRNNYGQLGYFNPLGRNAPGPILGLAAYDVDQLSGGLGHSLAHKGDGTVVAWGTNIYGQIGDGTNLSSYAPKTIPSLSDVYSVAAGAHHCLALKYDGTVVAWGGNFSGQLGDGTTTHRNTPVAVKGPGGTGTLSNIIAIAAGGHHSLALANDGSVYAWGNNTFGQLGDGTTTDSTTPVLVTTLSNVQSIAAGGFHSLAIAAPGGDNMLFSWGYNFYGQLGDGTYTTRLAPVSVTLPDPPSQISAGVYHSLALTGNSEVFAFGRNDSKQLGDNTAVARRHTPISVLGPPSVSVFYIAAGGYHNLAVVYLEGIKSLWGWGLNLNGQVGDGTNVNQPIPTYIITIELFYTFAGGWYHSLYAY